MPEKVELEVPLMLAPVPVVLVASAHEEFGQNVLTIAWCGVDCSDPPTIHVSIRPSRHSHRMIKESEVFTVNFPTSDLLRAVDFCGTVSGSLGDKFGPAGLTPVAAKEVKAPLIAECPVNIECIVRDIIPLGLHDMFLGEIVASHADKAVVKEGWVDFSKIPLISFVNGEYWSIGEKIGDFGCVVEKT
ncbi:MAG: flavin reductase family protein [bacterium]|nr:MAG: flavin reductase family protein [bacterium]